MKTHTYYIKYDALHSSIKTCFNGGWRISNTLNQTTQR